MRRPLFPLSILISMALAALPGRAHATVRPPSDSLTVEVRWLYRTETDWRARLRLVHFTTIGSAPGAASNGALAFRLRDSLAITEIDSALIVLPDTQVPAPGFSVLMPNAPVANGFRAQKLPLSSGFWRGALAAIPSPPVLPNMPVDVCWFVRVAPGTEDTTLAGAIEKSYFCSATGTGAGGLNSNIAFKPATVVVTSSHGTAGRRRHVDF